MARIGTEHQGFETSAGQSIAGFAALQATVFAARPVFGHLTAGRAWTIPASNETNPARFRADPRRALVGWSEPQASSAKPARSIVSADSESRPIIGPIRDDWDWFVEVVEIKDQEKPPGEWVPRNHSSGGEWLNLSRKNNLFPGPKPTRRRRLLP